MYICLCSGITEADINEEISCGAQSMSDLGQRLGVATGCGRCYCAAKELLSVRQSNLQKQHARPLKVSRAPRAVVAC